MEDSPIEKKRAQRKTLLRGMYGLVDGREGFTITPIQYFALGTQIGLQQDVTGQTVRFLVSEGLLEYKPASEAVALTHMGVVEAERQSNQETSESQQERQAQLKALPDRILAVLKNKRTKIQIEELNAALPDFGDLPDSDWYAVINDLLSDGMIDAQVVRSGIYGAIGAAYNLEITPRGKALTPEEPQQNKTMPIKEAVPAKLVTSKGECFEIAFQQKEVASNRDGALYLFHLNDLTDKRRGERLVSIFRFGTKEFYDPNYDARLETVLPNTIRRAFDSGRLTFDAVYDPHTYTEISLQAEDFRPQKPATGSKTQDLIRHEAYWLGFRHSPHPGYPIQFDSPIDLEYLGVPPTDVWRYVLLMEQRGFLEKVMEGHGRPTHRLIDAYEAEPAPAQKAPAHPSGVAEQWDVFISHATEDKDYVEPLVKTLENAGIQVWFDKSTVEWGDDLRSSIDRGLGNCRYGIVVFSKAFLKKKKWTEYELSSLFALEQPGRKIILPIWHGITRDDLLQYGAGFADRLAKISSKDSYGEIVESLLGLLGRSPDQKQDVSEVTLEAFYFNHNPDRQTFSCRSVLEMPAKYVDHSGADGSVMRSELEPLLLMIAGIDVKAVEALGWKPTSLRFTDAKTGQEKVFSGQLRDTVEPDTLKFAIHGGDAKSETKPTPQTPVTATPIAAKPNAIAYAWYETKGENAAKAKAFIRPSTQHDGWFSFENSFGEEIHGTKENIAMKFTAFDKSLILKSYVRMQHSTSDPAFNLG